MLSEEQEIFEQNELKKAAEPLLRLIHEKYKYHMVIVTATMVELLESKTLTMVENETKH